MRTGGAPLAALAVLLLALLAAWPGGVLAQPAAGDALLDTLTTQDPPPPWAARNVEISRKVLPDVQATTLPEARTPSRPPRLANPVDGAYQFHLARQALQSGNLELAVEKARSASRADPEQARYTWWLSGLTLRRFDPASLLEILPAAIRATMARPLDRKHMLVVGHQALLLYVALFWTLLAAAYLFRHWHDLGHDLSSWAFRDEPHRVRAWLPLLLPLGVLLLRPGWLVGLALISLPLLVKARGRAAIPLGLVWLAAALLCYPGWPALRTALPAVDPASETTLLVEAGRLPASPAVTAALEEALAGARNPARRSRLQMGLGLQAARRGDYHGSNRLFEAVLQQDPRHVGARVGLANNTYYLGRYDAAVEDLLRTQALAPTRGEIPFNLAQVYFKKLFVPEAEEALRQSRELGFDPPDWQDTTGEANGFSPVVYLGLSDAEVEASSLWEADRYPPLAHLAAWRHWLGAPPVPLWLALGAILLIAAGLTVWRLRAGLPGTCASCGCAICAGCGRVREAVWLCATCADTADRAKSDLVRATLLKNRSRSLEFARGSRRRVMGRLLPGSGHLAADELAAGILRLALLAVALFLLLFGWTFDLTSRWEAPGLLLAEEAIQPVWYPLPLGAWPGFLAWPLLAGGVLFLSLFILAQVDGASLRLTPRKGFGVLDGPGEPGPGPAAASRRPR